MRSQRAVEKSDTTRVAGPVCRSPTFVADVGERDPRCSLVARASCAAALTLQRGHHHRPFIHDVTIPRHPFDRLPARSKSKVGIGEHHRCSCARTVQRNIFVADGMEGFERAAEFPERLSQVSSAVAQELERLGITTLYTTETRALFADDIEVPINGSSGATQNIILLRDVAHRAAVLRVLAIRRYATAVMTSACESSAGCPARLG